MFKTKQFKDLRNEWYQKLKESGFEDIENTKHKEEPLKNWDSIYFQKKPVAERRLQRADYFYEATHMMVELHQCPVFLINTIDRIAWQLHSDGLSFREIARQLNTEGFQTNKDYVSSIINTLKKKLMRNIG